MATYFVFYHFSGPKGTGVGNICLDVARGITGIETIREIEANIAEDQRLDRVAVSHWSKLPKAHVAERRGEHEPG